MGGSSSSDSPRQQRWLTQGMNTGADGRARFTLTGPLPNFASAYLYPFDCRQCDFPGVFSVYEIVRAGVMGGMGSAADCHTNTHKLEEITAKPGEKPPHKAAKSKSKSASSED